MVQDADNLVLDHLRRISASQERMELDMQDLKTRTTAIEGHMGTTQVQLGGIGGRLDRLDERVARIERRLDLVEA
jgi:archaellum component FlaC